MHANARSHSASSGGLMKLRAWWRRRPLRPVPDGGKPEGDTAELARLELLAEQAYAAMYDVPPLRSVKDDYDNARLYFQRAIDEAKRLGLPNDVARLTQRRDHVCCVYGSQFRGF
jgi:hypothetical protein